MADLEHLKLIQPVITRMAGHSFVLKGWAVTIVTGLAAIAKTGDNQNDQVAWISLGVLAVFALLDAYYLALERRYRDLYADVLNPNKTVTQYSLALDPEVNAGDVGGALKSFAIWPLYGAAAIASVLVATNTI